MSFPVTCRLYETREEMSTVLFTSRCVNVTDCDAPRWTILSALWILASKKDFKDRLQEQHTSVWLWSVGSLNPLKLKAAILVL